MGNHPSTQTTSTDRLWMSCVRTIRISLSIAACEGRGSGRRTDYLVCPSNDLAGGCLFVVGEGVPVPVPVPWTPHAAQRTFFLCAPPLHTTMTTINDTTCYYYSYGTTQKDCFHRDRGPTGEVSGQIILMLCVFIIVT
jgi:hypothetical protein